MTEYLSSKGVSFQELDIRQKPEALRELLGLGVRHTPAIVISDKVIVGFNRAEIDQAIAASMKD